MNRASLNGEVNDRLLGDAPQITRAIDRDVGHRRALAATTNAVKVADHSGDGDARCRVYPKQSLVGMGLQPGIRGFRGSISLSAPGGHDIHVAIRDGFKTFCTQDATLEPSLAFARV